MSESKLTHSEIRVLQRDIRGQIRLAMDAGQLDKADVLYRAYRNILTIKLPDEPDTNRVPGSPINPVL